jgi:hypothetical protein
MLTIYSTVTCAWPTAADSFSSCAIEVGKRSLVSAPAKERGIPRPIFIRMLIRWHKIGTRDGEYLGCVRDLAVSRGAQAVLAKFEDGLKVTSKAVVHLIVNQPQIDLRAQACEMIDSLAAASAKSSHSGHDGLRRNGWLSSRSRQDMISIKSHAGSRM